MFYLYHFCFGQACMNMRLEHIVIYEKSCIIKAKTYSNEIRFLTDNLVKSRQLKLSDAAFMVG